MIALGEASFRTEIEQTHRPLEAELRDDLMLSRPVFELMRLSMSVAQTLVHGRRVAILCVPPNPSVT